MIPLCVESYNSRVKLFDVCYMLQIVKGWVKLLTQKKGYTDQLVKDANAIIYTFGSYKLGVGFHTLTPTLSLIL